MTLLFRLLSWFPLWFLHGAGWVTGWLAFGLSPVYRKRLLDNARQAGVSRAQALRSVGQAGEMVAELPRIWLGRPTRVRWTGAEHVDAALTAGRGLMVLTPHLGCFEMVAQGYVRAFGERQPMTALFRPARQSLLGPLVATGRQNSGLRAAPTTMGGVKQLLKVLRAGESVLLLPDQVPSQGLGVWAPFFGRPAYTMTLAARLAQMTGAEVLLAWGERLSWGRGYVVHVAPLEQALPESLEDAVTCINQAMEGLIRQCPQQYLWSYARYKQPRQESN